VLLLDCLLTPLLPDGRKKLDAVKLQILAKSGRKEDRKYFDNYLDEKPYNC
jgi:hypothetical protein